MKWALPKNVSRWWSLNIYLPTLCRLPAIFDLPPAIGFSLSRHTSSLRGCLTKVDRLSSSGLIFRIKHRLILLATSESRFTNSLRAVPAGWPHQCKDSPKTCHLCNEGIFIALRANSFSRLPHLLLFIIFFIACSCFLDDRREEIFSFFSQQPARTVL
jgi:hypothetical protein